MKIQVELDAHGYFVRFLNFCPATIYDAMNACKDLKRFDRVKILDYDGNVDDLCDLFHEENGALVLDVRRKEAREQYEKVLAEIELLNKRLSEYTKHFDNLISENGGKIAALFERIEDVENTHRAEKLNERTTALEALVLDPLVPQR